MAVDVMQELTFQRYIDPKREREREREGLRCDHESGERAGGHFASAKSKTLEGNISMNISAGAAIDSVTRPLSGQVMLILFV